MVETIGQKDVARKLYVGIVVGYSETDAAEKAFAAVALSRMRSCEGTARAGSNPLL